MSILGRLLGRPTIPTTAETARSMTHGQLISALRVIAQATMKPEGAPLAINSYEKLRASARAIGEVLNERGGFQSMRAALDRDLEWMPGCRTIEGLWNGIGDWLG